MSGMLWFISLWDVYPYSYVGRFYKRRASSFCGQNVMFDEMPQRDVISWNTMIMAYGHNGKLEED